MYITLDREVRGLVRQEDMGISTPPADVGDVRSEDAGVTDDGNLPYPSIYNDKSVLLNSLKHFMRKKKSCIDRWEKHRKTRLGECGSFTNNEHWVL